MKRYKRLHIFYAFALNEVGDNYEEHARQLPGNDATSSSKLK